MTNQKLLEENIYSLIPIDIVAVDVNRNHCVIVAL